MQLEASIVSIRAYQLWEQEGRPHGRDQAHWFEAERQLQDPEPSAPPQTSPARAAIDAPVESPHRGSRKRR